MKLYWSKGRGWCPSSNRTGALTRRGEEKKRREERRQRQRHREECHMKTEQGLEWWQPQGCQALLAATRSQERGTNRFSLWAPKKDPNLQASLFQTSGLQKCEINFCCPKPLSCGKLNPVYKDECPAILCVRRYWPMYALGCLSHFTENLISNRQSCHQDSPGTCPPSSHVLCDEGDAEA